MHYVPVLLDVPYRFGIIDQVSAQWVPPDHLCVGKPSKAKPYSAPITEYGFQKNRDQQSVLVIDPGLTLIRITETKS